MARKKTEKVRVVSEQSDAYDRIIKYTGLFGGVQCIVALITVVKTKLVSLFLGA